METAHERETAARSRTRRAILDAAIQVLGCNPGAPMSEVAAAAGVGRTTLHRYFAERSELLAALGSEALAQVARAAERARLDDGTAIAALERLVRELFDLGDLLMLVFNNATAQSSEEWEVETDADRAFVALIERGGADGTLDPALPPTWAQNALWALLYSGWEYTRAHEVTRHEALDLTVRTVLRVVRPPG